MPLPINCLAVIPLLFVRLTEWLPDETMQKIALENNLAETAFFVKNRKWLFTALVYARTGDRPLRPRHPGIGTYIIYRTGIYEDTIYFDTVKAGTLDSKARWR
jgi:predicted PhzF superfamily epimerase YddE/YHI9